VLYVGVVIGLAVITGAAFLIIRKRK
jgi:LPXTG-motif cell wall-anchored protein